jgi:hypothetical protein
MVAALDTLQVGKKAGEAENVEAKRAQETNVVREVVGVKKMFSVDTSFGTSKVGDL